MTALLHRDDATEAWGSMPGWGIVADLTPPELIAARRLAVLKKYIAAALALVLLLCALGYVVSKHGHSNAESDYAAAADRTGQLNAAAASDKLAAVTQLKSETASIEGQVATVTKGRVNVAKLITLVRAALPAGVSLSSLNVTVDTSGSSATSTPTLDTSGQVTVGTLTLAGTAQRMNEVATYVTALTSTKGITNVIPTGNTRGLGNAQWTITAQATRALLAREPAAGANTASGGN